MKCRKGTVLFVGTLLFLWMGTSCFLNGKNRNSEQSLPADSVSALPNDESASENDSTEIIAEESTSSFTVPARYLTKEYLLGKINQRQDSDFMNVLPEHTPYKVHLLRETYEAFIKMYEAAKKEGVELRIISAARTYDDQCNHWNAKWKKLSSKDELDTDLKKTLYLLNYCALPGISRHHWGTEIDLNSLQLAYFETKTGKKVYEWLQKNANSFGFYQPYTPRDAPNREKGFCEEKWHWSYRPLSGAFLVKYKELITANDITGFAGDNTVKNLNLDEWINSINPDLIIK